MALELTRENKFTFIFSLRAWAQYKMWQRRTYVDIGLKSVDNESLWWKHYQYRTVSRRSLYCVLMHDLVTSEYASSQMGISRTNRAHFTFFWTWEKGKKTQHYSLIWDITLVQCWKKYIHSYFTQIVASFFPQHKTNGCVCIDDESMCLMYLQTASVLWFAILNSVALIDTSHKKERCDIFSIKVLELSGKQRRREIGLVKPPRYSLA